MGTRQIIAAAYMPSSYSVLLLGEKSEAACYMRDASDYIVYRRMRPADDLRMT